MADAPHIALTINGRKAMVAPGTLVVEAARSVGIEIPVFCYHPKLEPVGACRMCLVEIEKMPRLQTACTMPVAEGMVVRSDGPLAVEGQQSVLELLLANHPLDCPVCDKGGECPLQDNTFQYGLGSSRMSEEKRHLEKAYPLSEHIALDRERCIMCLRCTRFHQEIPGDHALAVLDRGGQSVIGTHEGEQLDSMFSGNTIELCPVGALTSRHYRFRARPWDLQRQPSVCAGCAVGCNVSLHARDGNVLRMVTREHPDVDGGWLCDRGRFGSLPHPRTEPSQRPLVPRVRRGGALELAAMPAAIARLAELLRSGSASVVASADLTNEAVLLLQGPLARAAPGVAVTFAPSCARSWPLRGRIADIAAARRIALIGLDPWSELPILALWLRKAVLRGAPLVVIDERNGLVRDTAIWLHAARGQLAHPLHDLLEALRGGDASEQARAAAAELRGEGPAVLLAGLDLAADPQARADLDKLAVLIDARGPGSVCGAPPLAANGRGVQELAPALADARGGTELATTASTLLVLGAPLPPPAPGRRLAVATWQGVPDRPDLDVVLPMRHRYEQAGSLTNLEGRVQQLAPSGNPGNGIPADFALIAALLTALGEPTAGELDAVRTRLCRERPSWAAALLAPPAARNGFLAPAEDAARAGEVTR